MTLYEFLAEKGWWVIKPDNTSWVPVSEKELVGYDVSMGLADPYKTEDVEAI